MSSELRTNTIVPASGTNLTLGASGDTIEFASGTTVSGLSAGKVLQVVSANKTDTASTTSTSFVTTGLEVSITPSATSSKIFIIATPSLSSNMDNTYGACLLRNSTELNLADAASARQLFGSNVVYQYVGYSPDPFPMTYLDSPSSTSSITYKVAYKCRGYLTHLLYINRGFYDSDNTAYGRSSSVITAMEIAG